MTDSHPTLGEQRPYTLVESDDASVTLGKGQLSDWPTIIAAAGALAQSKAQYRQIVYDDDVVVRWLNDREEKVVELICRLYGLEVEQVER